MNYILDTHSFIWSVLSLNMLSKEAMQMIRDSNNSIHISVVTFWEISLKYSIGKLKTEGVNPEDFPGLAERSSYSILPISFREASTIHRLEWRKNHKDPFDRMLIWQAIQNEFTLISKDSDFGLYEQVGLKLLW